MKKKIALKNILAILIAIIMIAVVYTGCGRKSSSIETGESGTTAAQGGFPLTVRDANGFEMTIAKKPERIVSLTLGTDEMLLDMVDKNRIIALTIYADDPNISNIADRAKDIPNKIVSEAETVISLQPDLVFTDTYANAEFVQQLRDSNISVYVFKTPSNIEEQRKTVLEIAHVVGEDKKGQEIVAWMDGKLKEIEEKLSALKEEEKLTVFDYGEIGTSGKGTNYDDIVTRAGLINVVSRAGIEGWPQISKEKLVEYNPDIITVPSWFYDKSITLESFINNIKNDKSLADVKAVKNNRLLAIPNQHISAISHYVVLGVEDVAKAAYPELFK